MLAKYNSLQYRKRSEKDKRLKLKSIKLSDSDTYWDNNDDRLVSKETLSALLMFVSGFNDIDREIFVLRYLYHYSIKSIAEKLTLSRGAIDGRLHRLRGKIKEAFNNA